jgi:ribosome biogenesis protein NSA2
MEKHRKRFGVRMDKMERDRKREARQAHKISEFAQKSHGLRAKLFAQKRFKEKATLRKTLALHQEGSVKQKADEVPEAGIQFLVLFSTVFISSSGFRSCSCLFTGS